VKQLTGPPKGAVSYEQINGQYKNMDAPSPRTQVRRLPKRGHYDSAVIHSILDEGFLCHVGFVHDGAPVVIPTSYGRSGDTLYIHGSAASRMLRTLEQGVPVSIAVTLVDGLVLARSAFHHSINYRSVVIFGTAVAVTDPTEKNEALRLFTEQLIPGRWDEVRQPAPQELKATSVLKIALDEASAKVRTGGPIDDEEDYALPIWAGVLPLEIKASAPIDDTRLNSGVAAGTHITGWRRSRV
jgi:nitroimidazol reductase NimA-like FMN-containing flavoprotein (pyridoxamine 5'-phosphate oxidase superfamily)